MKRVIGILLASIFLAIASAFAGGKTVHVHSYYRKDGTYVHAYDRAAPGTASSTGSSARSTAPVSHSSTSVSSTTSANVPSKSNAPTVFVPVALDPARRNDPAWVPAKIVNGQYVSAHFKNEEASAASSTTTTRSFSNNGVPYTQRHTSTSSARFSSSLTVQRDAHGRIKRSEVAKHDFMRSTGYPNGRPGYVVDHIIPLKRGGCDCPSNMQWQTIDQAKAKDKWE
jgi:hypothetical protein